MINTTWSVLSRSNSNGNLCWSRRVDPLAFDFDQDEGQAMLSALIPHNDDNLRSLYIEEIVQMLLRSPQRQRILDADPVNTYEKSRLQFPPPGSAYTFQQEPTEMRLYVAGDDAVLLGSGRGFVAVTCEVNPNTNTLTHSFGEEEFTIDGNLSSEISLVPGLSIRLQSDFATALNYLLKLTYSVNSRVDWTQMLARAESVDAVWRDPQLREIWEKDPLWTNRLAAFATATVELFRRARQIPKT